MVSGLCVLSEWSFFFRFCRSLRLGGLEEALLKSIHFRKNLYKFDIGLRRSSRWLES